MSFPKFRRRYSETVNIIALMDHYQVMKQNQKLHGISLRTLFYKILIEDLNLTYSPVEIVSSVSLRLSVDDLSRQEQDWYAKCLHHEERTVFWPINSLVGLQKATMMEELAIKESGYVVIISNFIKKMSLNLSHHKEK